jgi:hypothetical protein
MTITGVLGWGTLGLQVILAVVQVTVTTADE